MNRQHEKQTKKVVLYRIIGMALLAILGIVLALNWEDITTEKDGETVLTPDRERKIDERERRLQKAELYALLADVDGYYECPLCPQRALINGKYYLHKGNVYRYGVTTNRVERYSTQELTRYRLKYVVLKEGTLEQCLIEETYRNAGYALLAENLARPEKYRLAIPPGSGVDLR